MKQKTLLKATLLLLTCFLSFSSRAAIIYVDSAATGLNNGSSWVNAYTDFATGILASSSGDSVFVSEGTYQPSGGTSFSMKNGVKIYGGFSGLGSTFANRNWVTNITILEGNGNSVIRNTNITSTALIDGFTITGGSACSGGGISNNTSSPVIQHCIFTANVATGAFLNGCSFGGAIDNLFDCAPLITDCSFLKNIALIGSAITINRSSPVIKNCSFSGNHSPSPAGGILIENDYRASSNIPASIINCVLSGNEGGVANNNGSIAITGCIFSGNDIGAIVAGGETKIVNCTISGNKKAVNIGFDNVNTLIQNCVFYGNASEITHSNDDTGHTTINNSILQNAYTGTGMGNKVTDPLLVNAPSYNNAAFTGGDYHLRAGSPAIDAGKNDSIPPGINTDVDGNPRIQNGIVDMGAYEYSSVLLIKLISFTGYRQSNANELQWEASTTSATAFTVQRSANSRDFESIGIVNAPDNVIGNSFHFIDNNLQAAKYYYRLQMIEADGQISYSNIILLENNREALEIISFYPSPLTGNAGYVNIISPRSQKLQVVITDIAGRQFTKQAVSVISGTNTIPLTFNKLAAGAYMLKLTDEENNSSTVRFIKN